MAYISHRWPFITPWSIETLELQWWAYYVRCAQGLIEAQKEANNVR
jgi:hypothetical protein